MATSPVVGDTRIILLGVILRLSFRMATAEAVNGRMRAHATAWARRRRGGRAAGGAYRRFRGRGTRTSAPAASSSDGRNRPRASPERHAGRVGPACESRRCSDAGGTSSGNLLFACFPLGPRQDDLWVRSAARPSRRGRSRRGECDRIGASGVEAGSRSTSRMGVTSRVRCAGYGALTRQPRSACPASPAERTTSPEDALRCRKRGAGADFGLDALHVDKRNQDPRQRGHHR